MIDAGLGFPLNCFTLKALWVLEFVYGLLELVFFRICSILKHTFTKLKNILLEFEDLMIPKV